MPLSPLTKPAASAPAASIAMSPGDNRPANSANTDSVTRPAGTPVSMVDPSAPDLARYPRYAESARHATTATLEPGDAIIDGGNTFYKDDIRRAQQLAERQVHYVDVGTSGGVWGLERGYCMMIGGEQAVFERLEPLFASLAPGEGDIPRTRGRSGPSARAEKGYIHAGPPGAGHYVKMVHNGIEYGLMQAYAEGFDLLRSKGGNELPEDQRFDLNVAEIAEVWRRGSVVTSWLLDLTADALVADPQLAQFSGSVSDSGEGRWTIDAAVEQAVPVPVLSSALFARFRSRQQQGTYGDKILSAMRLGFGGHVEKKGE